MANAVIFGAGGHARVVQSLCAHRYATVETATTDGGPGMLTEAQVYAQFDDYRLHDFYVAIGDNANRRRIYDQLKSLGARLPNCVAEAAWLAPNVQLGSGVVICPGAVIMTHATLGNNTIVNTLSSVDHDCIVGDHSQITVGVTFAGGTRVGSNCFFAVKSATIPNVSIGDNSRTMAGAIIVRDVPPNVVVGGCPARVFKTLPIPV